MSRFRWLLAATAVVAILVIGGVIVAAAVILPGRDPNAIHAVGSLPDRISVCGRTWTLDTTRRQRSYDDARTWTGVEPVVVAPGPGAPCPSGPCGSGAGSPCDTVVFVRVGGDAYVDYALSGGP
jgi:hypothetical protein